MISGNLNNWIRKRLVESGDRKKNLETLIGMLATNPDKLGNFVRDHLFEWTQVAVVELGEAIIINDSDAVAEQFVAYLNEYYKAEVEMHLSQTTEQTT